MIEDVKAVIQKPKCTEMQLFLHHIQKCSVCQEDIVFWLQEFGISIMKKYPIVQTFLNMTGIDFNNIIQQLREGIKRYGK